MTLTISRAVKIFVTINTSEDNNNNNNKCNDIKIHYFITSVEEIFENSVRKKKKNFILPVF